jgi:hypothetical protein
MTYLKKELRQSSKKIKPSVEDSGMRKGIGNNGTEPRQTKRSHMIDEIIL